MNFEAAALRNWINKQREHIQETLIQAVDSVSRASYFIQAHGALDVLNTLEQDINTSEQDHIARLEEERKRAEEAAQPSPSSDSKSRKRAGRPKKSSSRSKR